ncbi:MAG: hypothetical protein ACFCGT_20350 [Sandaracinaceae bacterium]
MISELEVHGPRRTGPGLVMTRERIARAGTAGLALAVAVGCGSPGVADAGPRDLGVVDLAVADLGMTQPDLGPEEDPCAASLDEAVNTVGCNGRAPGPALPGELGGSCTADADRSEDTQGTCEEGLRCWALSVGNDANRAGVCVATCTPSSDSYVSRGDCPAGYRCFDAAFLGEAGTTPACFADCQVEEQCGQDLACNVEGSCFHQG